MTSSGKTNYRKFRLLLFVLASSLIGLSFLGPPTAAQTTFGSITGSVTDATGAVIPSVPVVVTNEGTGQVRQATTGGSGAFNVPDLVPGSYRIHIEASGFAPFEKTGMNLNANQVLAVDAQLSVSAGATAVEVSAAVGVIDTQTATLDTTKSSAFIEPLPVVSRGYADVGAFGYVYTSPGVMKAGQGDPTVNGGRMMDTVLSLDGIGVNAYVSGMGGGPTQPSIDAVQEVHISLAETPPEFARPANITVITKSGSNALHGSAYYDYNGSALNARDYFSTAVPFRVYNQFAVTVGGPIKRNKTFYFLSYDQSLESATETVTGNEPLPAWRNGDFLGTTTITDPTTGLAFPNNTIPASRISPVSQAVQAMYFQLPNYGPPGLQANNVRDIIPYNTGYTHFYAPTGRLDEILSAKDLLYVRYNYRLSYRIAQTWPEGTSYETRPTQGLVASWNHILSSTTLNELRGGFVKNYDLTVPHEIGSTILSQLGIQGVPVTGVPDPPGFVINGIVSTSIGGGANSIGGSNDNLGVDNNYQFLDAVSVTRGAHFMKFGGDFNRDLMSGFSRPGSVYGTYNFTGTYTGLGYADFLLGIPQTTNLSLVNPTFFLHGNAYSVYAQDQYKVSRRLTLNYGVRYEVQSPYTDINGNIFNYDPARKAIIIPDNAVKNINPLFPTNLPIMTASQAGYPANSLLVGHHAYFYPRFGVAFRPFASEKTVIRAGYGIFDNYIYAALTFNEMVGGPFSGTETFTNKLTNGVPLFSFPDPFLSTGTAGTQNTVGINPDIKQPYTQQYTLTFEQQLGTVGLRIGYVRSQSVRLLYTANINQPGPSLIPYTAATRAYTDSNYNTIDYINNGGTAQYNALQISSTKSFGSLITFSNAFVWAKDLTDTPGTSLAQGAQIQNPFCLSCETGPDPTIRKLRGNVNLVVRLPVGRNQRFLSHTNRIVDGILGGWSTSWVSEMESGSYFTPSFTGFDVSNTNTIGGRPDVIGNPYQNVPPGRWFNPAAFAIPGCPATNPVCTNPTPVGRYGNSGVGILVGPTVINWDLAASKTFFVREGVTIRFRALATNVFNHPNFATPASSISVPSTVGISSATFGEQTGEADRQVHLSLRLEF